MKALAQEKLLEWNGAAGKYQLTALGQQSLLCIGDKMYYFLLLKKALYEYSKPSGARLGDRSTSFPFCWSERGSVEFTTALIPPRLGAGFAKSGLRMVWPGPLLS